MNRLFRALGIASLLTMSFASTASAHHITDAYADCDQQTIVVKFADFSKRDWPATMDGPGEYEINDISSDHKNGTFTFPLFIGESGGTGHYTFQWARGFHGFDVQCEEPTPTPTPTPVPTPTPIATPTPEIPCDAEIFDGENSNCPTNPPSNPTPRPTPPPTDTNDNSGTLIASAALSLLVGFVISLVVTSYLIRRR